MNGFSFSAGGGGRDEPSDPAKMASSEMLANRKIAPLKRRGAGRGAGRGGGTANLPNVFAGAGQGVVFGAGSSGAPSPSPAPSFGGGTFGGTPTPPVSTSFGNGSAGGFSFGQQQQQQQHEQPKSNPFASLAPAAPTNGTSGGMFGTGSFGSANAASATNGMFGNANGATTTSAAPSFGGFGAGTSNDKPAAPNFSFGQSTAAPSAPSGGLFGGAVNAPSSFTFGSTTNAPKEEPKPATSGFLFGQSPALPKGESKTPSFTFGQSTATSVPEAPKPAPSFTFGPSFQAPATTTASDGSAGFGMGLPTDAAAGKPSGFMFGQPAEAKAPEPAIASLFGAKPSAAPTTSGFNFGQQPPKETPAPSTNMFSKPAEQSKPAFGFVPEKKDEAPAKPLFGLVPNGEKLQPLAKAPAFKFVPPGAAEKKEEPAPSTSMQVAKPASMEVAKPVPMFGLPAPEKKDTPMFGSVAEKKDTPMFGTTAPAEKKDTPMFGSAAPEEKKEEPPKSLFGTAPPPTTTGGGFMFGSAKPAEKPAEKPSFASSLFGSKPADFKPAEPKAAPVPQSFGFAPATTASSTTSAFPAPAEATPAVRMRSPPLPADSHKWSTNQLTDYYNLFAIRSLNHSFKEELAKQDIFADFTPLCNAYIAERRKIVELMEKNQRYKFADSTMSGGKRPAEDIDMHGGGKRRALGEEPKVNFAPTKSTSSQALASVLGGKAEPSKAPSPKQGSIFDNYSSSSPPPPSTTAWANPFKTQDTSNLPEDASMKDDDSAPTQNKSGGLFGRITPPKDTGFKVGGPSFAGAGDQTWSPDKGFKFAPAPASGGLFGTSTSTNGNSKGGLFGNTNGSSASSGLFGSKPASAPAATATATSTTSAEASASENEGGEPSDAPPPPQESTLSLQGPGEEDEDSMFEVRALVYDMSKGAMTKAGVGALRVLKNRNNGKARIIVRSDIGKVLVNVALLKKVTYNLQDKRCLKTPEFLPGGGMKMWGLRVGKEEKAEELRKVVEEVKGC